MLKNKLYEYMRIRVYYKKKKIVFENLFLKYLRM